MFNCTKVQALLWLHCCTFLLGCALVTHVMLMYHASRLAHGAMELAVVVFISVALCTVLLMAAGWL